MKKAYSKWADGGRRSLGVSMLLVMVVVVVLSCAFPRPSQGAVGTYTWTPPTHTVNGTPINPDRIHHYVVFYRTAGNEDDLADLEPVVYDEYASPPWDTMELDPHDFYQFAVTAVDTLSQAGLMGPWSNTWYPAGNDSGRLAAPGAPELIDSRVW